MKKQNKGKDAISELVGALGPESQRRREIKKYTRIVDLMLDLDVNDLPVIEKTAQSLREKLKNQMFGGAR
jgi:hypothetical protein